MVATIKPAVDSISDDAEFKFVPTTVEVDTDKLAEALPEFDFSMQYDEPAKSQYPDFYEDISSVSSPEYYGEGEEIKQESVSAPDPLFEQTIVLQNLGNAIFSADDFDDSPLDFSYQPDFDGYFDDDITTD